MNKSNFNSSRLLLLVVTLASCFGTLPSGSRLAAQQPGGLSPQVAAQVNALIAAKASRTPSQLKMDSQLVYAAKMARGERIAPNVATLRVNLSDGDARGVVLDVRAEVSDGLMDRMRALGAEVLEVNAAYRHVRIRVGLGQVESIAGLPEVTYVQPKQESVRPRIAMDSRSALASLPKEIRTRQIEEQIERAYGTAPTQPAVDGGDALTSIGSRNSEGDATHRAAAARATYAVSGAGVRIGVISDGVTNLAASQASGDLGPVTVLAGQAGSGDEGTAMLEIIHDLAPNAELYFASGTASPAAFAQNIRNLQAAGCTIIVDDLKYPQESPFQDGQVGTSATNGGIITQAVKDVAAAGVLYFSSAGNYGNQNDNASGTWEGDFVDGGDTTGPLAGLGRVHNFGGQTYNQFLVNSIDAPVNLFWSDPLGASANDYDLYILDSTGTSIVAASDSFQDGTQDPFEATLGSLAGERAVIVKFDGSARFLHLDTNGNRLQFSTAGSVRGHAATTAPNSFGVAATPAQSPGPYPAAFSGANVVNSFSSDGPRRIFFAGNGTALTPGNFSSSGGQVLQKPDFTAADRVSVSGAGGFPSPFIGTSAAAPHAAAIAALVKSKNLVQTATQVRNALFNSAIDIEAPGVDRDSGIGILMADRAVAAAATRRIGDFDADGRTEVTVYRPSTGTWFVLKSSTNFTTFNVYDWGEAGDVPVPGDFDGDGRTDVTVYRPSTGTWFVLKSSTNYTTFNVYDWGEAGDAPVSGDFDGDGRTEVTVYRPSTGTWFVLRSSTNYTTFSVYDWGEAGDVPVAGDFDGDGRTEVTVYRPSTGTWFVLRSSTNYAAFSVYDWGEAGDVPVVGDFDGDGRADVTVYRPSTGTWFVLKSSTNYATFSVYDWGEAGDVPVPGDYDGDGRSDVTVFRPSTGTWFVLKSSTNYTAFSVYDWGEAGDTPALQGR